MEKKIKYAVVVIFLITQICIAVSLLKISSKEVDVYITNGSIEVDQAHTWYISR